jgi:hypothetical protein
VILQKTDQSLSKKEHAMTSVQPIDPSKMLSDQLAVASPDLLRNMMSTFIQALMSADADAVCGAGYGERSDERVNHRNGYRHRDFDTRVGTIDVTHPETAPGHVLPGGRPRARSCSGTATRSISPKPATQTRTPAAGAPAAGTAPEAAGGRI